MSRFLLCTMLVALLAGGPGVPAGRWPDPVPGTAPPKALPNPGSPAGHQRAAPPGPEEPDEEIAAPGTAFGWPLSGSPAVVRAFEAPEHRFGPGHRGVDLAGEQGAAVLAAGAGTVVFAGPVGGLGVVSIDHPGGLRTTYTPISPSVRAGDLVTSGQPIGTVQDGHAGCPVVTCLHWGARRGLEYLDPLRLLGLGQVRLLPWADADGSGER